MPDDPTPLDAADPPAPGWYADHHGAVRWWDGAAWTDRVRRDDPAPSRRVRWLVGAGVAGALFCVVAVGTVLVLGLGSGPATSGRGPAAVVEANFAALRDGDCAAYVATFSAADRRVMGESFCRQSAVFGADGLGELVVTSTEVDGDTARVSGTFTDGRGEQSFSFDLVLEDGRWLIRQ